MAFSRFKATKRILPKPKPYRMKFKGIAAGSGPVKLSIRAKRVKA